MTFYPCPICGHKPTIRKEAFGYGPSPMWVARCWCSMAIASDKAGLERRWNRLHCANDPADGRDCL